MCTIQAPHRPVPQPNLVPVSFNPSRITHNNGVAGGASVDAARPFTLKLVAILSSLSPRELRAVMNAFRCERSPLGRTLRSAGACRAYCIELETPHAAVKSTACRG